MAKKYGEIDGKLRTALAEKVIAETRTTIEPKIAVLDADVAKALGAPTDGQGAAAARPAAPAKAPAKK